MPESKQDIEMKFYHPIDIQRIFGWNNIHRARELMNSNGFPCLRINNEMVVERKALEKWVHLYEGEGKRVITNRA